MKVLEWSWKLPDGQQVNASFEPSTRVESVWLGTRLVSRSTGEGRPDGHAVPLGGGGGAYRGPTEARVVFDVFGSKLGSCVLTLDGETIAPSRAPRTVRSFALPTVGAGFVLSLAFLTIRLAPTCAAHSGGGSSPEAPPHSHTTGPITHQGVSGGRPTPSTVKVPWRLDVDADHCFVAALAGAPSLAGKITIDARVNDGRVSSTEIVEHGGLPPVMETCVENAVKEGDFIGVPPGMVRIPMTFSAP